MGELEGLHLYRWVDDPFDCSRRSRVDVGDSCNKCEQAAAVDNVGNDLLIGAAFASFRVTDPPYPEEVICQKFYEPSACCHFLTYVTML